MLSASTLSSSRKYQLEKMVKKRNQSKVGVSEP